MRVRLKKAEEGEGGGLADPRKKRAGVLSSTLPGGSSQATAWAVERKGVRGDQRTRSEGCGDTWAHGGPVVADFSSRPEWEPLQFSEKTA
jgi:hypothetical protein